MSYAEVFNWQKVACDKANEELEEHENNIENSKRG